MSRVRAIIVAVKKQYDIFWVCVSFGIQHAMRMPRIIRPSVACLALPIFPHYLIKKKNSVALVRKRTIPTERPPPVGEVSANFCG